jgi:hypothetical protein
MPHYKDSENKVYWLDAGDDPAVWLPQCTPITDDEADALRIQQQEAAFAALTYVEKRLSEYPPITDYLDGVVKSDQVQIDKYIADCWAIKAKYPKE